MKQYAKAIVGCLAAALGSLYVAYGNDDVVSGQEWVAVAVAAVGALVAVWGVPNKTADPPVT